MIHPTPRTTNAPVDYGRGRCCQWWINCACKVAQQKEGACRTLMESVTSSTSHLFSGNTATARCRCKADALTSNWIPAWVIAYALLYRRQMWTQGRWWTERQTEGASSVMMCYDFSWEHTFAIDGKRDQLERRDTCVCVKQPHLGATSCFGPEFHLISCSFCLSGGNEDTEWG